MKSVFLVQHSYEIDDCEETKIIGIYSAKEKAEETVEKYKGIQGFKDYPDSFYINDYIIDQDNWTEGFIKSEEDIEFLKKQEIVKTIIDEWDPINLFPDAPENEYLSEVSEITDQLIQTQSYEELAEIIRKVFIKAFNEETFGWSIERCKSIAEKIIKKLKDEAIPGY